MPTYFAVNCFCQYFQKEQQIVVSFNRVAALGSEEKNKYFTVNNKIRQEDSYQSRKINKLK